MYLLKLLIKNKSFWILLKLVYIVIKFSPFTDPILSNALSDIEPYVFEFIDNQISIHNPNN